MATPVSSAHTRFHTHYSCLLSAYTFCVFLVGLAPDNERHSAMAATMLPLSLYSAIQRIILPLYTRHGVHTRGEFQSYVRKAEYREGTSETSRNDKRTDGVHARDTRPLIAFVIPIINNAPLGATTDRRIKCINNDNRVAVNAKSKIHRRGVIECKRGRDQSSGSATGFRRP